MEAKTVQELTDKQLVAKIKKGSLEAYKEVIARYEVKAFNLALRYTRNKEDAEEVLQDVFITVFKKIKSFKGKSAFSSWLYRVTVNAAYMKLRKRKQDHSIPMEELSPGMQNHYLEEEDKFERYTDCETVNGELREMLELAIGKLPEEYRSVFVLRDVDGLSNKQVAKILDITIPAVKSRLHRSRLMLRKKLKRYYDDFVEPNQILAYGPKFMHDGV